ncbi:ferredoxin-like protein [Escherichia coli]|uniref:ferredoxin-like protein n=1 Tax=Escherichia coli TaxID=562 RepID=UPI001FF2C4C8|nr:ferredoxin-like protein [Escherichia coli]
MNPVDRPLLDIGLTRLEFLRISGKGLAGLTIAPALLSLLGCKQEDIDSGTVGLINTPKGVLVTQRERCTGCHRCEISCTNFNDGSVGTFFSRIKIHRNYFFGDNGVGSGGGLYGDLNYTADTCRQCKEPQCMNVCPIGAITWQQKEGCITVDHKRCIGCSACTTACPWMMATVNTESKKSSKCVLCGECANACPTGALKIIEWKDITV